MAGLTCAVCDEEIRWGTRGGRLAYWHKDDLPSGEGYLDTRIGHEPVLGTPSWVAPIIHIDDVAQNKAGEVDDRVFEIPPPEVYSTPVDFEDDGVIPFPGGAKNLIKAVRRAGGDAVPTYSRAARVHALHGNLLGMSDYVMVKFFLADRRAVAVWEDQKFDTGYILLYDQCTIYPKKVRATDIRAWLLKWQGPLPEGI